MGRGNAGRAFERETCEATLEDAAKLDGIVARKEGEVELCASR